MARLEKAVTSLAALILTLTLVWVAWTLPVQAQDTTPRFGREHGRPAIVKTHQFNLAPPGANTDALSTDLSPSVDGSAFRVTVALTNGGVFNVVATDGTTTHVWGLNGSNALSAADLYTFTFGTSSDLDYNFQVETDGTLEFLGVEEVVGEGY